MIRGGAATAIAIALSSTPAIAQPVQQYEISEQGLDAALKTFAAVSGREVIAPSEILIGKRSRPVYGTLSAEAALARLLVGTGLRAETVDGAFVIRRETGGDMTTSSSAETDARSEEHTSELQSLMRISYAVFCLKKKN